MATKSANGTATSATSATPADLTDQINTLRDDLGALTQIIADLGKSKGDEAVAATKAKMSKVRDTAADQAETARLQAMELQDQASDFVRNQPAAALGVAAGLGFLVGLLSARK